jgi:hypothetical protein
VYSLAITRSTPEAPSEGAIAFPNHSHHLSQPQTSQEPKPLFPLYPAVFALLQPNYQLQTLTLFTSTVILLDLTQSLIMTSTALKMAALEITDCNPAESNDANPALPRTDNDVAEAQINEPNDARIAPDAAAEAPGEEDDAAEAHEQGGAVEDDLTDDDAAEAHEQGGAVEDDLTDDGAAEAEPGHLPDVSSPLNAADIVQACDRISSVAQINVVTLRRFDGVLQHFCRDKDQQVIPTEFKHRRRQLEASAQALQKEYNNLIQDIARAFGTHGDKKNRPIINIPSESCATALDIASDAVTSQDMQYWDMMGSMDMARKKERRFWRHMARIYAAQESSQDSESQD